VLAPATGAAALSGVTESSEPAADGSDDRSVGHRTPAGAGDAVLAVFEGPARARIVERLARQYRVSPDVAEEWCQDAYVKVSEHFAVPGRRAPDDPTGYAYAVSRNVANRQWGRGRDDPEVPVGDWDDPPSPPDRDPSEAVERHDGDPVRLELELAARSGGWEPWLLSATLSLVTLASSDGPLAGLPRPRAAMLQVLGWQALHLAGRGDLCVAEASDRVRQTRSRAIRRVTTEVRSAYDRAAARGEVAPHG